jgi:hypothetical protein
MFRYDSLIFRDSIGNVKVSTQLPSVPTIEHVTRDPVIIASNTKIYIWIYTIITWKCIVPNYILYFQYVIFIYFVHIKFITRIKLTHFIYITGVNCKAH